MNADRQFREWIRPDVTAELHIRGLLDSAAVRPSAVCRVDTSLMKLVGILVRHPAARNAYDE